MHSKLDALASMMAAHTNQKLPPVFKAKGGAHAAGGCSPTGEGLMAKKARLSREDRQSRESDEE